MSPTSAQVLFESAFGRAPEASARAPGRVEFIGNHTDYNGGLVLGAAIDRHLCAAVGPGSEGFVEAVSGGHGDPVQFEIGEVPPGTWAAYPAGVIAVLSERARIPGCRLSFDADLPVGAGLSSSAAIEIATAVALDAWLGLGLDRSDVARLARRAENEFVGVPCGILDQAVVAFGRTDHLVLVDASTDRFEPVPVPGSTRLWLFDSGIRHRLGDGHYAKRHAECGEAFERLRERAPGAAGLAQVPPRVVEEERPHLPNPLYRRARHVTGEHGRVEAVLGHLAAGRLRDAGAELFASHASSRDDFENSLPELDLLVERLAQEPSVLGARLTGGGWGGAVLAWTDASFGVRQADAVARVFETRFGRRPTVLACRAADGARSVPVT